MTTPQPPAGQGGTPNPVQQPKDKPKPPPGGLGNPNPHGLSTPSAAPNYFNEWKRHLQEVGAQNQRKYDKLGSFAWSPDKRAEEHLGYVPSFGQDPRAIAKAYQIIKATPEGAPLPDWIAGQKDQIAQAYEWFSFRNNGAPDSEWKYLSADDPAHGYLSSLIAPPQELPDQRSPFTNAQIVQQGQANWTDIDPNERQQMLADPNFDITQYPVGVRDQILNDPNFDWSRLPKWQKKYWEFMSSPWMQLPMAVAGAKAGGIFGIPGSIVGGAGGYLLGRFGGQAYDPTAKPWEQPTTPAKMMGYLNFFVDNLEMKIGSSGVYSTYKDNPEFQQFIANNPDADKIIKEAARGTFESSTFLGGFGQNIPAALGLEQITSNRQSEIKDAYNNGQIGYGEYLKQTFQAEKKKWAGQLANPFKGERFVIGSSDPIMPFMEVPTGDDPYTDIEDIVYYKAKEIDRLMKKGYTLKDASSEVWRLGQADVGGQMGDFIGQMAADPLNVLPETTNALLGAWSAATGKDVAFRAFTETHAPFEAARRYKTLVQAGDVPTSFRVEDMGTVARMVAGLNEQGQIKAGKFTQQGILDTPGSTNGIWSKIKDDWTALTPEARAREGASMFYNNIGALLSTFDDPMEVGKFVHSLSGSDMKIWKEMGGKIANSPEWYTILPALKDFDAKKLDGLMSAWELAAPKRDALLKISDVLGEEPGKFVEDLAKRGTAEQDFQRVVKRLQESKSPQAKEILASIERGEFTPDSLKDIVDAFTGEGALYWHPDQFKAATLDALGAHFDEWTANKLGLADTPEARSAFFRTAHLLKSAQSVLLLGGSPGYALQNGLSNMVHRAATGIYGYMTPKQIDGWLTRFGVEPARLQEGVGMGGMVESATTKGSMQTSAIDKALRPDATDSLGKAQRFVSGIGKTMPFNKLSSWFESIEGKNAYMIAMKDMWNKTWKRGAGFQEMTPELRAHVERAGINPNTIYSLIEAGMNKAEIEQHILGRQSGILARSLVTDAAQKTGMTSSQASAMLDKIGVLDELDSALAKANTPDKVRNAFKQAMVKADDYKDMQTARDLLAMAEDVKNKVAAEGAPAALDVIQRTNTNYFDTWQEHYARFGEMFEDLREIPDIATRNKAIELNYKISDGEFRRINARTAANYQAIFDTWGRSQNPHAMGILASLAQQDAAMKNAYDFMRSERKAYFEKYSGSKPGDLEAQAAWFDGQSRIDAEFQRAFKSKTDAERAMGDAMGNLYNEMYGPAAGEAARKWWGDYTKFSAEIVKREQKFRASLAGLDKEAREAAKQKWYSTDKVAQIAELEDINKQGIQRLEKVIKKGGDQGQGGIPTDPNQPSGPTPFDDVNQLVAEAEQRQAAELQAKEQQVASVWDMAEAYNRESLPYDRRVLQDRFALLGALKKEEYGGIPDLKGLDDPRLTPDKVREVMDRRAQAKTAEVQVKVESAIGEAVSTVKAPRINENTSILRAISEHGGIDYALAKDLTGDARPKTAPGVFRKKGIGIDEMARLLADDGYPIDMNDPMDPGGIQQTTELLNRARSGDKIRPVAHDPEAALAKAEWDAAEKAMQEALTPEPFDEIGWQAEIDQAVRDGDLGTLYERIGELPEEMGNQARPSGETYNDYMSRIADETAARVEMDARDTAIAEGMVRAEEAQAEMQARSDAAMTRQLFREQIQEAFGLSDEQANAYMEISDSVAAWYERTTGESGDAMYARYYEDVRTDAMAGDEGLYQLKYREIPAADVRKTKGATYRGQGPDGGTGVSKYGKGLYSTTDRGMAAGYGEVVGIVGGMPDRPLEIRGAFEDWLLQNSGEPNMREFYKKYPDPGEFVKSQGYDGVIDGDVVVKYDNALYQLQPVNRRMTGTEVEGYARALARQPEGELSRALKNENVKADRVAILNEVHKLNPDLAEKVAKQHLDILLQDGVFAETGTSSTATPPLSAKGAVTFGPDGIRATIHAFEAGDISTLVHENAHVYRRMLSDVVSRTGDTQLKADLGTLEEWAGARDGVWDRAAEEKFARGFEKYLTDGEAPTPKLRRVFESFKTWMLQVYKQVTGSAIDVKITPEVRAIFDGLLADSDQRSVVRERPVSEKQIQANVDALREPVLAQDSATAPNPNALFQDPYPFGTMDNASGFKADSEWMDQGYSQHVRPLLKAMQETAIERLSERSVSDALTPSPSPDGRGGLSPEGQKQLNKYIKQVQNDMGSVKLSTMKWGESQRDFAMLNYNRRYGFDKIADLFMPYQFYYTRSMITWGMRALDKPSWYANYARLRNMQNKHERDIPERLRNKFKIDAPWLPDWMGDALYIDPIQNLFTPEGFKRPFEIIARDKNYQVIEAERILQQWAEDGQVSEQEILQAAQTQQGSLWERAQAEAAMKREAQIASPFDFMATMFGPAWYLSTPLNLLGVEAPFFSKGDKNQVTSTPLLKTSRAFETVTKGTWAEPIGQLVGLIGRPEEMIREKAGLPEFGEYGDYYVDRQLTNMVADGLITSQQAQVAMIERQGEIFDQARERVKMELALRTPLTGTTYALTHEGLGAGAQAFLPSLFGSGLLPAGELEYRGLKDEWNAAWKKYDAGDKTAINNFFDEHPEYEAYLAKGKEPEEKLRSFMIGNIWDKYMELGETNQKAARAQMGDQFQQAFLNKETRAYDSIDVGTLTQWAQMLGAMVPNTEQTAPMIEQQAVMPQGLDLYSPEVTAITDKFFTDRREKFDDYYFLEQGYYSLPKSERTAYLRKFPRLKEYWDWKYDYYERYPELEPIFKGKVFKQVDTTYWPPTLEDYVASYAMTGAKLPKGAFKSLEQVWIREGQPYGDMQIWLDAQVVPAMLYQPGQ